MWLCSLCNCTLHFPFRFLSPRLIYPLQPCVLGYHTHYFTPRRRPHRSPICSQSTDLSFIPIAVPPSLSHPSAIYILSIPHSASLSLHQNTFYSLWLDAIRGSPLPHPGTPQAAEGQRTEPANQRAANTAAELFTGSGQQAFCVRLL